MRSALRSARRGAPAVRPVLTEFGEPAIAPSLCDQRAGPVGEIEQVECDPFYVGLTDELAVTFVAVRSHA